MSSEEFKSKILPYYKDMWRIAYAILGSGDEASDAVQDAMLRLWTTLCDSSESNSSDIGNLAGYCINTVRNISIRVLAGRKPDVTIGNEIPERTDIVYSTEIETLELSDSIVRLIEDMPPSHGEVMKLSSFAGLKNDEIAQLTGLSHANVRAILSRERKKIKDLISKHF